MIFNSTWRYMIVTFEAWLILFCLWKSRNRYGWSFSDVFGFCSDGLSSPGGATISFLERLHLYFIRLGNQYILPLKCWMDLKLFLNLWLLTYGKNSLKRHWSFGGCNHQDIFMVVNGIKMVVACLMSLSKNLRYKSCMLPACYLLLFWSSTLPCLDISVFFWKYVKIRLNCFKVFVFKSLGYYFQAFRDIL